MTSRESAPSAYAEQCWSSSCRRTAGRRSGTESETTVLRSEARASQALPLRRLHALAGPPRPPPRRLRGADHPALPRPAAAARREAAPGRAPPRDPGRGLERRRRLRGRPDPGRARPAPRARRRHARARLHPHRRPPRLPVRPPRRVRGGGRRSASASRSRRTPLRPRASRAKRRLDEALADAARAGPARQRRASRRGRAPARARHRAGAGRARRPPGPRGRAGPPARDALGRGRRRPRADPRCAAAAAHGRLPRLAPPAPDRAARRAPLGRRGRRRGRRPASSPAFSAASRSSSAPARPRPATCRSILALVGVVARRPGRRGCRRRPLRGRGPGALVAAHGARRPRGTRRRPRRRRRARASPSGRCAASSAATSSRSSAAWRASCSARRRASATPSRRATAAPGSRRRAGSARWRTALVAGALAAAAGVALALGGGHLGALSLDLMARSFPGSQVGLAPLARLLGEHDAGPSHRGRDQRLGGADVRGRDGLRPDAPAARRVALPSPSNLTDPHISLRPQGPPAELRVMSCPRRAGAWRARRGARRRRDGPEPAAARDRVPLRPRRPRARGPAHRAAVPARGRDGDRRRARAPLRRVAGHRLRPEPPHDRGPLRQRERAAAARGHRGVPAAAGAPGPALPPRPARRARGAGRRRRARRTGTRTSRRCCCPRSSR